ncbi:uncharacterized protein LOC108101911 isoform X2 [Drosophila ficusphila]|uniref:uncharacterized protein LOC108101911 isoform X1 n=1 Tax=Drosophila ficusphila TaxID=30025 RepID=UPI0007E89043|nr:uncharacterized protein LOC108101911 isoform X1 [Drosophila ficusphila]XP_017061975.1 uncharacterized protein LOC108101911 isoform X2 [Drosophila ficusphila]
MKVLGALLVLLFIDSIICDPDRFETVLHNCTTSTEARKELTKIRTQEVQFEPKCLYHCFFEASEIITNGKINQSGFNTAAEDAEKAKPCKAIEDPDRCELAYKFEECVKEQLNFSFFS